MRKDKTKDLSPTLSELEEKRQELGIEFMRASTPEEVEFIKGEMAKLDYEIEELIKRQNARPSRKKRYHT